jgi:protease IV
MKEFFKYTLATLTGIIIASFLGLFALLIIIGIIVGAADKPTIVADQSMLVINLENQIVDRAPNDPFSDLNIPGLGMSKKIGLDQILTSIDKVRHDDRIKCIYLDLSIVNGGMAAVEEIRNALLAFRDSCDKPVYAYGDMFDQKAYYLATVADKVVLNPYGALDFKGLGVEITFFRKALEKLGVEIQIVRHGKFKASAEPFMLDKMSDENRGQTLVYLNSFWNQMLRGISDQRNIPVEKLNQLADDVMTFRRAEKALEAGLVDELKYKDQVLDDLREITGVKSKKGIPVVSVAAYSKASLAGKGKKGAFSRNKIAVIYASGEIGMPFSGSEGINGDKLSREIRKVRQDSTYKAIVLRVDSPGGTPYDSEVIWREVKLAADEKVVVVSMGNFAASGGYYISCAADKIVAQPNTITGSIGIFGTIPNAGELLNNKLGITTDIVKTNEHSDMPSITRGMTEFERNLMQAHVEDLYDVFVTRVADGRRMDKTAVDEIGQGRVWSGENALEIGLVDQLGGLDQAVSLAAELAGIQDYRRVSLPEHQDPIQELFRAGGDNIRLRILKSELGEAWRYYDYLKKTGSMNGIYARIPYDIDIR